MIRGGCGPVFRAIQLSDQRTRPRARLGAVHPRGQSSQLSRRRPPRNRRATADRLPRHAARLSRDSTAPVLPPADRVDPRQSRASRPRGHQRVLSALDAGHHRHLPGGPVQPGGAPRRRAARGRADRTPIAACPLSPRRSRAPTRRCRPSLLSAATAPGHRALRRPAAFRRTPPRRARARRSGATSPARIMARDRAPSSPRTAEPLPPRHRASAS